MVPIHAGLTTLESVDCCAVVASAATEDVPIFVSILNLSKSEIEWLVTILLIFLMN